MFAEVKVDLKKGRHSLFPVQRKEDTKVDKSSIFSEI